MFFRLPKDADSAAFGRGSDPARYTEIVSTLRKLLVGAMTHYQIGSEDDRKALSELIATPFGKDTNVVQASGHNTSPLPKAAPKGGKPIAKSNTKEADRSSTAPEPETLLNEYIGWYTVGFDEGPDALAKMLKQVVATYNRKGLRAPLQKELGSDARFLPTIKLVTPPAVLGKGALDMEIKFDFEPAYFHVKDEKKSAPNTGKRAAAPEKRVTISLHLMLMPDGNTTWLGFGMNKDELVRHLLMSKSGAPEGDTLASRQGLEALKNGKNMSGGFFSVGTFLKSFSAAFMGRSAGPLGDGGMLGAGGVHGMLGALPHKGETPIFFTSKVTAGNTPRVDMALQITKESVEDVTALIKGMMSLSAIASQRGNH